MTLKTTRIKLTVKELAIILKINELTVVRMAKGKEIPCEFVNGRPFFYLHKLLTHFKKLERELVQ